jgi:hypothetical protein
LPEHRAGFEAVAASAGFLLNANDPDGALRQPYGDARGAREAAEILKKLLALGLSKFEPDPLGAIAAAEQRQTAK